MVDFAELFGVAVRTIGFLLALHGLTLEIWGLLDWWYYSTPDPTEELLKRHFEIRNTHVIPGLIEMGIGVFVVARADLIVKFAY